MDVIEVNGLRKSFGAVRALNDITLSVADGEIFGLVGPNGAGKTTTVECLAGAVRPDAGTVRVLGIDPVVDRALVRERVGYQFQSTALPAMLRVGEALDLFATFYATPADPGELLRLVGLEGVRSRPFGALSGGQRQRLSIALALVGRPTIAVFDELTTGLDPQGRRDVLRLVQRINASGVTIVLVTHFLEEADRLVARLAVIDRGVVRFAGTPDELREAGGVASGEHALEEAYLRVLEAPDGEREGA